VRERLEAIEAVAAHAPDLLFLDVQMPRLTGFETLELLEPRPAVVFVTAYDRHAVKAFEVNAVDYLLKPFSRERFDAALAKARTLLATGARRPDPAALAAAARPEGAPLERIAVREGTRVTLLPVESVEWAKAEDDYVLIRSGGRNHLKHQTLADLATQLPVARFVRVHRSWVVKRRAARLPRGGKDGGDGGWRAGPGQPGGSGAAEGAPPERLKCPVRRGISGPAGKRSVEGLDLAQGGEGRSRGVPFPSASRRSRQSGRSRRARPACRTCACGRSGRTSRRSPRGGSGLRRPQPGPRPRRGPRAGSSRRSGGRPSS